MSKFFMGIAIIIVAASQTFAQSKTAANSAQPSQVVGASATASLNRERILERNPAITAKSRTYSDGQIISSNISTSNGHAAIRNAPANNGAALPEKIRPRLSAATTPTATPAPSLVLTQVYRVGIGDVLDV